MATEDIYNTDPPVEDLVDGVVMFNTSMSDETYWPRKNILDSTQYQNGQPSVSFPAHSARMNGSGIHNGFGNQTLLQGEKNRQFSLEPQEHEDNCTALDKDYDTSEKRLKSYQNFPIYAKARPRELADNGLYYLGVGDKVKCAYCKGLLYNWEMDDDPVEEHHRHFPACPFITIRYKRLKEIPQEKPQENYRFSSFVLNTTQQNVPNTPVVPKVVSNKAEVVGIVKRFGYDDDIVEKAYNVLIQKGESDIKSNALLDVIFDIEENPDKYAGNVAYAAGGISTGQSA